MHEGAPSTCACMNKKHGARNSTPHLRIAGIRSCVAEETNGVDVALHGRPHTP